MTKKKVSFGDYTGGAISKTTRVLESAAPSREDYTTVMRGAAISKYSTDSGAFYRSAFDMNYTNQIPYFVYEQLYQGEKEGSVKQALKKGLSGYGASRDPPHIQKAVHHSLKEHPRILQVYTNS